MESSREGGGVMRRILVVDDEVDFQTVLAMALELQGYLPTIARNGEEALAMLHDAAAQGEPFDAMLLDMAMPEVDGWHVLHQVRRDPSLKKMPIVAVTARATSPEDQSRLASYGAMFVEKRHDYVNRMLEMLGSLWGTALLREETG